MIRIPKAIVAPVMMHAKILDETYDKKEDLNTLQNKYKSFNRSKPVNVATIPLRSPFRYPGGKTWFVPYLRKWILSLKKPEIFVEPFAGGAIGALTIAFEDLAEHVIIADTDPLVSSVWRTILNGQAEWLADQIKGYDLTLENVKKTLLTSENTKLTLKEKAFLTILRNRVQRGGILAPGAGLVKSGENNKGIKSRWYPETLANRILDISSQAHKISFFSGDGFELITQYLNDHEVSFFIDPPYIKASSRLYNKWQFDHNYLFELLSKMKSSFIVTYDNTNEIKKLIDKFSFDYRTVKMKNTHHAKKTEIIISNCFEWFDQIPL